MRRGEVAMGLGSAGARKGVELTGGAHLIVTWERGSVVARVRKLKKGVGLTGEVGPDGLKYEENYF
jgi:hypothetical protein